MISNTKLHVSNIQITPNGQPYNLDEILRAVDLKAIAIGRIYLFFELPRDFNAFAEWLNIQENRPALHLLKGLTSRTNASALMYTQNKPLGKLFAQMHKLVFVS